MICCNFEYAPSSCGSTDTEEKKQTTISRQKDPIYAWSVSKQYSCSYKLYSGAF